MRFVRLVAFAHGVRQPNAYARPQLSSVIALDLGLLMTADEKFSRSFAVMLLIFAGPR